MAPRTESEWLTGRRGGPVLPNPRSTCRPTTNTHEMTDEDYWPEDVLSAGRRFPWGAVLVAIAVVVFTIIFFSQYLPEPVKEMLF
jgi:hypothetical protein